MTWVGIWQGGELSTAPSFWSDRELSSDSMTSGGAGEASTCVLDLSFGHGSCSELLDILEPRGNKGPDRPSISEARSEGLVVMEFQNADSAHGGTGETK